MFALTLALRRTPWVSAGLVIGVGSELGQLVDVVPGSFDPVDLAVLIVCAALGLLIARGPSRPAQLRPLRPLRPVAAMLTFAVLAAGTGEPETEAQKDERMKKDAEAADTLAGYERVLEGVLERVAKVDLRTAKARSCKKVKVTHKKGLRSVHIDFLKRFGADKSQWSKNDGDWSFITDSLFGARFEQHADDRNASSARDTASRVVETFLPEQYLVIVVPDDHAAAVLPVDKKKHFDVGFFDGWVFLADQVSGELVCGMPIYAESSDYIDYGGLFDGKDPQKEMQEDFEDNLEAKIEAVLPNNTKLSTSYGSVLR